MKFCTQCGEPVKAVRFCGNCGSPANVRPSDAPPDDIQTDASPDQNMDLTEDVATNSKAAGFNKPANTPSSASKRVRMRVLAAIAAVSIVIAVILIAATPPSQPAIQSPIPAIVNNYYPPITVIDSQTWLTERESFAAGPVDPSGMHYYLYTWTTSNPYVVVCIVPGDQVQHWRAYSQDGGEYDCHIGDGDSHGGTFRDPSPIYLGVRCPTWGDCGNVSFSLKISSQPFS